LIIKQLLGNYMKIKVFFKFAFMAGLATYANSSWAVSSESLSRAGLSANADLFPFVNLTFGIPSDGTFLTQGNFAVTEDGRRQTIRDFIPPESAGGDVRIVDIVFVHDDSASLDDEAAQVKANIRSFLTRLAGSNLDYRIGLVPYGGSSNSSPPGGRILNNGNLHSDSASLIAEIERMRFDGGIERAFEAMQIAIRRINWRPSAQKVLILITDTGCTEFDLLGNAYTDNCDGEPTESKVINELRAANATVYALTDPEADDNDFDQMVAQTGGKLFNVTDDFSIILNEIGTALSAQYLLQYRTDKLALDGQSRTVKLTVKASDAQGRALQETFTAYYTPIPPIQTTLTPDTFAVTQTAQNDQSPIRIVVEIARRNVSTLITAYCFYKSQASVAFNRLAMTHIGNNLYEVFIPAEGVLAPFFNFYIEAEDTQGKTTLPSVDPAIQPFTISVLPNELPLITHTPITFVQQGQDIVISATVTDTTNQVNKVTLYYRKTGRVLYQAISQTFNQTDVQFMATIPGEVVTANGIEYYLSAEDSFGALNTFATADAPHEQTINTSPNITHSSITSIEEGKDIVISAKVVDNRNHVSQVTLYYRKTGEAVYQSISNDFNQPDVDFTATIPGKIVTTTGIQYYLSAADDSEISGTFATQDNPVNVAVWASGDGGGGGGCTLGNRKAPFDPLFPLLVMLSLLYLYRRRLISNDK
jgi:hypothetical protein